MRILFYESEMREHRMGGECAQPVRDAQYHRFWIDALEFDFALAQVGFHTGQHAEKVVVPECAPEFPIGDSPKADIFLSPDNCRDLAILDRLTVLSRYIAFLAPGSRFLQRHGTQQASDMIGTERGLRFSIHSKPRFPSARE